MKRAYLASLTSSGYKDFHVFYRIKINANQWPTDTSVTPNQWHIGQDYAYFFSWKHWNIGTGFTSDSTYDGDFLSYSYGDKETLVHIKHGGASSGNLIIPRLETQTVTENYWSTSLNNFPTNRWVGIEYHVILEEPAYTQNGKFQMWIYDEDGNQIQVFDLQNVRYRSAGNDDEWANRVVWGGNNSQSFSWGETMNSIFYVDDVVIDANRIGPTYYTELASYKLFDTISPDITSVYKIDINKSQSPIYLFNSNEPGTITYEGSCSSATTSAIAGENTINFNALSTGTYSDCTITVTDANGNASTPLQIPEFTITYSSDNDLDKDVDIFDYNILLGNFGTKNDCQNPADTDENCEIDIFDYNSLLGDFGKSI